jgi:hypothetical protein
MSRTKVLWNFCMLFAISLLATAPGVTAQDAPDPVSSIDNIQFNQISLSVDGVYAVDTSGQAWKYDFEKGEFEKTTVPPGDGGRVPGDRGGEAAELPVEVRCTEEISVQPYEKSVVVGRDEFVDGDVTAFGKVTIRGWVKGSVQSISGPVIISEGGQVDGDIRSPEITVRRGGVHLGRQILTDPLEFPKGLTEKFEAAGLWVVFGLTLFFLLATFLYLTLMPNQVETFGHCVARYPVKSAAVGFLFVFGLPILVLLLAITLVGILVIPLVPFAYLFAISLGVITTGKLVGHRVLKLMGGEFHPLAATGVGLLTIMSMWALVAVLMGSSSPVAFGFGIAALVISILISIFPVCAGIGAAVLTRFGFRKHISLRDRLAAEQAAVPAPAPPPIRRTTPFDVPGQPPTPPPPPVPPTSDPQG